MNKILRYYIGKSLYRMADKDMRAPMQKPLIKLSILNPMNSKIKWSALLGILLVLGSLNFTSSCILDNQIPMTTQSIHNFTANELEDAILFRDFIPRGGKIITQGGYAFLGAEGTRTLIIYDISHPGEITEIYNLPLSTDLIDFEVQNNILAISLHPERMLFYDISDPSSPTLIDDHYEYGGTVTGFVLFGDILIAVHSHLSIFEGDWRPGEEAEELFISGLYDVAKLGSKLFMPTNLPLGEILCYNMWADFSLTEEDPIQLGSEDRIYSMEFFGNYLLIGTDSGFYIANASDHSIVASLDLGVVKAIAVQNRYAYLADGQYLTILDMEDISNPQIFAQLVFDELLYGVALHGTTLAISTESEFFCVQIGELIEPINLFVDPTKTQDTNSIFIDGKYGYLAADEDGLLIYDLETFTQIGAIAPGDPSGAMKDVYVEGGFAFVIETEETPTPHTMINVYNVSNPKNPVYYEYGASIADNSHKIIVQDRYMLIPQYGDGITIYDFTGRTSITFLTTIFTGSGFAYDAALYGNLLYLANYDQIITYDMTDRADPVELYFTPIEYVFSLQLDFPFLYAGTNTGITIYDLRDSPEPTEILALSGPVPSTTFGVQRTGNLLLSANKGLTGYDISSFTTENRLYMQDMGASRSLSLQGDLVGLTDSVTGLSFQKIMEVGADDVNNVGTSVIERLWGAQLGENGNDNGDDNGQQEPNEFDFDWQTILTYGLPGALIFAVVFVVVKGRQKKGPKAKKGKASSLKETVDEFSEDLFDTEF